jgi:hypothetical protein
VTEETVHVPCKRKGCTHCGPRLRRRYVAHFARRITEAVEAGARAFFVTLTVDPKVRVEDEDTGALRPLEVGEEARRWLRWLWSRDGGGGGYVGALRYRCRSLDYVGAVERHANGFPHLHLLVVLQPEAGRDPVAFLRECWKRAGGGAVVDVKELAAGDGPERGEDGRPTTVARAAGYVVKYIFKDAAEASRRDETRRTLCSKGFGYHADDAAEKRREAVRESADDGSAGDGAGSGTVVRWFCALGSGGGRRRRRRAARLTAEDRARFERADLSRCTNEYREKMPDGTWRRHVFERGRWTCTVHAFFPGRRRSRSGPSGPSKNRKRGPSGGSTCTG